MDDQLKEFFLGLAYILGGLSLCAWGIVYLFKKILDWKKRLLVVLAFISIGVFVLLIWPVDQSGERLDFPFVESFLGIAIVFSSALTPIVRYFVLESSRRANYAIVAARKVAEELNLEAVGIPEEKSKKKITEFDIWFKGYKSNRYFTMTIGYDFWRSPITNKVDNQARHYTRFYFFPEKHTELKFRIDTLSLHYINPPNEQGGSARSYTGSTEFDEKISLQCYGNPSVERFFKNLRVRNLILDYRDSIDGFIDMNIEEGKFVLKSKAPHQNDIKVFSADWRDQVTNLEIENRKRNIEFCVKFLNYWDEFE